MRTQTFALLAAAVLLTTACAGDDRSSRVEGPMRQANPSPLALEPSRRDPLGYTGRPTVDSPYNSELETGSSLPAARDQVRRMEP